MKVVINKCFGGFGLSNKALKRLGELQGKEVFFYKTLVREGEKCKKISSDEKELFSTAYTKDFGENPTREDLDYDYRFNGYVNRNDTLLIQVVEELGEEASGMCADLKIIEIPDDVDYAIEDYDGNEWVAEKHRIWE